MAIPKLKTRPNLTLLRRCVKQLGGITKTAELMGYETHWGVGRWFHDGRGIPTGQVGMFVGLCRKAGIRVTCHELRPDKFPAEQQAA